MGRREWADDQLMGGSGMDVEWIEPVDVQELDNEYVETVIMEAHHLRYLLERCKES